MDYRIITNLPTVGADNDTWGDELNAAVLELDAGAARKVDVYDKTTADATFVKTVNGVGPDVNGDVTVAAGTGGGGGGSGTPLPGSVTDVAIAPGGLSPTVITGTAVTNGDTRLTDARNPKTHKASHAIGGVDAIAPSDIGAINTAEKGVASGVATLGVDAKVPTAQLPTMVQPGVNAASFRLWVQATAPSAGDGAADGHVWIQIP